METYSIPERRACRTVSVPRNTYRYTPVKREEEDIIRERIIEIVANYGRLRWTFQIPIKNVNINFSRITSFFFVYQSNLHIIVEYNDASLVHYSISSESGLLQTDMPKKMFSSIIGMSDKGVLEKRFNHINQYKDSVFRDNFHVLNNDGISRKIHTYDFKGNVRWVYPEPDGLFQSMYSLDSNSTMYLVYWSNNNEKSHLQAIAKNGKLVWEKENGSGKSTNPLVDTSNQILIGNQVNIGGNSFPVIYYFDDSGKVQWKWIANDDLRNCVFVSDLAVNSDGSIFFVVQDENQKLYCIKLIGNF